MMRLLIATALGCLVATPALSAETAPVRIEGGRIRGEATADGRLLFRGVPYAAAPVDALRFRPPAPVKRWVGVRDGTRSAPSCAQLDDGWNKANADFSAEDCLYLEVGTAALAPTRPMPVMVWIHGGSNKAGGGAGMIASSIVRQNVVLVSINYRLGPLGFMAHSSLTAEGGGASGNYGLMDQQAALRWVQRNIAAFGGDPTNVTIFGESAGAQDVGLQQLSPGAKGLFHKAIEESGTAGFGFPPRDLAASEAIGEQVAAGAGKAGASAADLRALPARALLEAARQVKVPDLPDPGTVWLQVTVDGRVITEEPAKTLARGGGNRVPLILGTNAQEIGFSSTAAEARAAVVRSFGAKAPAALRVYRLDGNGEGPPPDPVLGSIGMQVATDLVFGCPADVVADAREKAGVPVWQYLFRYGGEADHPVAHASEIRYVIGRPGEEGVPADAPPMQAHWVQFARTGDPNGAGLAAWPRYGAARRFLSFGAGKPVAGGERRAVCRLIDRP
jgi:para-nitrobenzyl esterase